MLNLTPAQRRFLRAEAHGLHPIVMIGHAGLSEAVMNEITQSLKSHELMKIKVAAENRSALNAIATEICDRAEARLVQTIGKIVIIYKPAKEPKLKLP